MRGWLGPALVDRIVAADAALRTPVPLSRRVAFVETYPGVGSAELAAAAANRYALRRHAPVLLVDAVGASQRRPAEVAPGDPPSAKAGAGSLVAAGLDPARTEATASTRRARPQSLADALDGLPTTGHGVACLGLPAPAGAGPNVPTVADWEAQAGVLARFLDVVVTDFGARRGNEVAAIAPSSHAICVVTPPGRPAVEAAVHLARQALASGCPAFVTLVASGRAASLLAARRLAAGLSVPALVIRRRRPGIGEDEVAAAALTIALRRGVPS